MPERAASRRDGKRTRCQSENASIQAKLLAMVKEDNVCGVLSLVWEKEEHPLDSLLLWVRPEVCCLHALATHVRWAGLSALASVGCGTGLLEWLLQALTGVTVAGYEVNQEWWRSKYAPPTFIPLSYVDPAQPPPVIPPTHALMCCYFNAGEVFRQYVSRYKGPVLVIIGSTVGGHLTDPHPLDYQNHPEWSLSLTHRISQGDIMACYNRRENCVSQNQS